VLDLSKSGLSNSTIQKITTVLIRYSQIERVILYGSRAKGNFREGSDIDLAAVCPESTFTDLLKIHGELDDLLLPYNIDFSIIHQIENPDLISHIERIGINFYLRD
jgi:predicted nucleotidyltransferase